MNAPQLSAYTVVGCGAIGGTLAYHLARAGHPVTVVDADPEHIAAISANGITLVRAGESASVPVQSAITPGTTGDFTITRVLLAVKAQATETALEWIAPRLREDGFVVSLQNGLNEDAIAGKIGAHRTVGAFVNLFADVSGPGQIQDGGLGALVVGEMDGSSSERVQGVVKDLQVWGPARATTNVAGYLWSKLGFGAMLSATALADAPMANLIDRHRQCMYQLTAEIFEVARAENVALEPFDAFDPAPYAGGDLQAKDVATDRLVEWLRAQAKDRSGIWRDLAIRRRPTEVPTHYGAVLRCAESNDVPTPLLRRMLEHIADLEGGGEMSEERLQNLTTAVA